MIKLCTRTWNEPQSSAAESSARSVTLRSHSSEDRGPFNGFVSPGRSSAENIYNFSFELTVVCKFIHFTQNEQRAERSTFAVYCESSKEEVVVDNEEMRHIPVELLGFAIGCRPQCPG